jgi:hypothetical protein
MWQSPHSERSVSLAIGGKRSSATARAAATIEMIAHAAIKNLDIPFASLGFTLSDRTAHLGDHKA